MTSEKPIDAREAAAEVHERAEAMLAAGKAIASYGLNDAEALVYVGGMHELAKYCAETAKALGLQAISEGQAKRYEIAEILEVHPVTISRWAAEAGSA